jgi:hypothetical protein
MDEGFSYVPRAQSSFLKTNRSKWVMRFFRFHPAGIVTPDARYSKQFVQNSLQQWGMSKDKGTASFIPLKHAASQS